MGSRLVGRSRKKRIDTMNDCLKKSGFECYASKENGVRWELVRGRGNA